MGFFAERVTHEELELEARAAMELLGGGELLRGGAPHTAGDSNALGVIQDKEHLVYWRMFRSVFPGDLPVSALRRFGPDQCPACHWELSHFLQDFCVTCGHWPARSKEDVAVREASFFK
jgi:hypothetical protein